MDDIKPYITNYLKLGSRNKIVIYKECIIDIPYLNVGKSFSIELESIINDKHFALKAKTKLDILLMSTIVSDENYGKILAINNLGILFEKELKIDFLALIDKYSKDNCLFVQWDGELKGNDIYFLTKEKGIKINIENLSHIKL